MRVAEMNELAKHQVQYGHQKVELLSKRIGLSTGETRQALKGIKMLNDFWHWSSADEYLDYLKETDSECEQRLMEKNSNLSIEQ
jgi:hypothetical protein